MLTAVQYERKRQKVFRSARALAREAGIDADKYAMFEGGAKYRRLTMDEAQAVARVLNVPVGLVCKPDGTPHVFA
jgi:hypothetical protein